MESSHLVFVYGTLRSGQGNSHLLKGAHGYGTGQTEEQYAMYLVSGFPYVTSTEPRYPITGELYAVDDATLEALDRMEGHPRYYERRQVAVLIGGERYMAWMYFRDPRGHLLPCGDFAASHSTP